MDIIEYAYRGDILHYDDFISRMNIPDDDISYACWETYVIAAMELNHTPIFHESLEYPELEYGSEYETDEED